VFGRIREQVKNRKASVQVSRAERAGVKVSLETQIASAYINLRVSQAQLAVAQIHSQSQSKVLKIAEARFEAGLASMLDVDQARVVYYNTVAMVPMLENTVHTQINAIAVLLGDTPDALYPVLETPRPLPGYIQVVAAGVPADLLRRRPDVVQAEEQIGVEATALGIAKKDWLPRLSIEGSVGTQAHSLGDLGNRNAFVYSVAPTLSWTVFDGLARKYNISAARKQMDVAIDNYNLTVLTAFQETDNALSTYFASLKYIRLLDDLVSSSRDYDRLSIDQYKNGLTAFLNVANAQMSYLENQNTLIQAQGRALTALIDLYRALGGGWSDTDLRN
ncbi:MAG: TolC family protein, partial [Muribaculaceae bacterium]|nr:TolC family protein [Muribaculaceae bacterium]